MELFENRKEFEAEYKYKRVYLFTPGHSIFCHGQTFQLTMTPSLCAFGAISSRGILSSYSVLVSSIAHVSDTGLSADTLFSYTYYIER